MYTLCCVVVRRWQDQGDDGRDAAESHVSGSDVQMEQTPPHHHAKRNTQCKTKGKPMTFTIRNTRAKCMHDVVKSG